MSRALAVVTLLVAVLACGGPSTQSPTGPGPMHATPEPAPAGGPCRELGCENGFRLDVFHSGESPMRTKPAIAGKYTLDFEIDGEKARCEGALPLPACDAGRSFKCTGAAVTIGESGCALPPQQHLFDGIAFGPARAKHVKVTISRDGRPVAEAEYRPSYQRVHPNGPSCAPACDQAGDALTVR